MTAKELKEKLEKKNNHLSYVGMERSIRASTHKHVIKYINKYNIHIVHDSKYFMHIRMNGHSIAVVFLYDDFHGQHDARVRDAIHDAVETLTAYFEYGGK